MLLEKGLIVIDYTNDFVKDNGKLTCGRNAQSIEKKIVELINDYLYNDKFIALTVDLHYNNDLYHPESKLFPSHNILGTKGRELYGEIKELYNENKNKILWIDKTRYSAFVGTDLELKLRSRGIIEVHIVGVSTDICVLHTAIDAYNKGFKIVIHSDGVASFSDDGHKWALQHFEYCLGAIITNDTK